ncbi:MAG: hypothetical protein AB7U83_22280 [Vicinamibacterales bacterium]
MPPRRLRPLSYSLALILVAAAVTTVDAQPGRHGHGRADLTTPALAGFESGRHTTRRIADELQRQATAAAGVALRLDVALEVVGRAPARRWLAPADRVPGAATYGAPSHDDMLTALTPPVLRATAPYRRLRPSWGIAP